MKGKSGRASALFSLNTTTASA
jgi:hypothetical protein